MIFQKLHKLARKEGLTLSKLAAMESIMNGPKKLREISEAAQHSTAATTGLSDSLEKSGMVDRVRLNPKDRRAISLVPTPKGRRALAKFTKILAEEVAV